MNRSDTLKDLAPALAKAQRSIKAAVKDSVNPHFRSKYADLGAVWEACREALTANGLSVVQMPVDVADGRVGLTTMLLHESGEFVSSTVSTPLTKNDAQGVGSALTYLRRYALAAMVGVVADDEDDGNAAVAPKSAASGATPTAQTNPDAPRKGATITGVVSDVKVRVSEERKEATARYTIDGVRYITARLPPSYADPQQGLQDGDILDIKIGNPAHEGATWADILDWRVPEA